MKKATFYSIGLACLISVPIVHQAQKSWYSYQEVPTIQIEYVAEGAQEAIENMERIAEQERQRQELIDAEMNRKQKEQMLVDEAQKVLEEYQVEVPEDIAIYCERAGKEFNICAEFLEAICWKESTFRPRAENAGCSGIMQISTRWHQERMKRLGVTNIYDAEGNIRVGADYLTELFADYDGDTYEVLKAYNGDSSKGVSDYAIEICEVSAALERVHGK